MGAGKNRKKKDRPSIKPPENITGVENTSNGGEGGAKDLCVAFFNVKINQTDHTTAGATAQLLKADRDYAVMVHDQKVGSLLKRQSSMVEQCNRMGINYIGEVINKNGGVYARFFRTS